MKKALFAAVALAAASISGAASAGEVFVAALKHDVTFIGDTLGVGTAGREGGVDLQLGVRSERIDALSAIGRPSVHALVSFNTDDTSNFVAAGFNWPLDIGGEGGFYIRPGLGLAYTDGETDLPPVNAPGISQAEVQRRLTLYNTRIDFGSKVLFEPEFSLGYKLTGATSVELTYMHLSNGQIFHKGKNQGLDDVGLRVNVKF
ncbi:MAG: acyloxyacyl hydrolase [Caulobacterales bacterium 68-7]|nr:acyloxyacyl hydrolase [Caulobacterales bacterium]OJU13171.1 MAG: acyloxyacyl hydrolase [Caulobacterales bacterium 68-7]